MATLMRATRTILALFGVAEEQLLPSEASALSEFMKR